MGSGCPRGGILRVLEFASDYPSEIRADFRTHYSLSWDEVGETFSWLEAVHLVRVLFANPNSWLQAAKNGWRTPVTAEWMLLADLIDVFVSANSKNKTKPIPRPWPKTGAKHQGSTNAPKSQVLAMLDRMNQKEKGD